MRPNAPKPQPILPSSNATLRCAWADCRLSPAQHGGQPRRYPAAQGPPSSVRHTAEMGSKIRATLLAIGRIVPSILSFHLASAPSRFSIAYESTLQSYTLRAAL